MQRLRLAGLGIAGLSALAFATNEIIALGWTTATINGQSYNQSQGDSLPGGWSCTIIDTNATKVAASAAKSLRGVQTGTATNTQEGSVNFRYKLRTNQTIPQNPKTVFKCTVIFSTSAGATVHMTGYSRQGVGLASVGGVASGATADDSNPEASDSDSKTYAGARMTLSGGWASEGGGWSALTFTVFGNKHEALAKVYNPSSAGGNTTVVEASGSTTEKLYPASFRVTSGGAEFLSGTTDSFLKLLHVDIVNTNGVPVMSVSQVITEAGVVDIGLDDLASGSYRFYFFARGSLRKRIDANWDPATGLSGLDLDLLYGDLDGDGYVSQSEVDFIYAKIGATSSDLDSWWGGAWTSYQIPTLYPWQADVDGDGTVTTTDYNLAAPNVGTYGDQEELTLASLIGKLASGGTAPIQLLRRR